MRITSAVLAVLILAIPSVCFAEVLNEEYKLLASDGRYGDYFGRSISIKSW